MLACTVDGRRAGPVLIIEDDPDIRDTLTEVLEKQGYAVRSACNGREGLDALGSMERPRVILLDLMMPVMTGPEFLEELHQDTDNNGIPVVVVSAFCDRIEDCDVAEVIRKPASLQAVLASVQKYCQ